MILKTYTSKSAVSVRVSLNYGTSALITFEPQTDGGSMFETTETALQSALESHSKYGKLFTFKSSTPVAVKYTYPAVQYYDKESSQGNVVLFTPQQLTEQERQQARDNIGASASEEEMQNVVRYSEQTLTEQQQEQARLNIDAEQHSEVITTEEMEAALAD